MLKRVLMSRDLKVPNSVHSCQESLQCTAVNQYGHFTEMTSQLFFWYSGPGWPESRPTIPGLAPPVAAKDQGLW